MNESNIRSFTVRQLISQLLFYPMDAKVCIECSKANDVLDVYDTHFIAGEIEEQDSQSFVTLKDSGRLESK